MRAQSRSSLQRYRKIAANAWELNDRTHEAVQRVITQTNLPPQYLAVHIRRGDKAKERPLVPLRRYVEAIKLMQNSNGTVFIATDDGSVIKTMREQLAGRRVVSVTAAQERKGHIQKLMNRMYLKQNEERVVALLAEIEMMRKATVFIGTFSSNLGRLVHVLRDQEAESSVSLDDKWAPGVAFRTFGQNYCGSKQANEVYCNRMQRNGNKSMSLPPEHM
ncbi:Alpha-(1,6)-fucosyltransferase [Gracilaria domingensis]|nr:Alpha-(1,6)-fucosyltransferase [Gracilaria domingensis]